jgi:hypothetical protein
MQEPSVERAFLLKPGIGYLRVSSFDEKTGRLIRDAIEKLGGRNLKGLVLDLRNVQRRHRDHRQAGDEQDKHDASSALMRESAPSNSFHNSRPHSALTMVAP